MFFFLRIQTSPPKLITERIEFKILRESHFKS